MIARDTPFGRGWTVVAAGLLLVLALSGLTDAVTPAVADEPPVSKNAVPSQEAGKPGAVAEPIPEHIAKPMAALRGTTVKDVKVWAAAIRELVQIGEPAVLPLIEELDHTTEPLELRLLGFTLRSLGDPRAVPALIRAIPRTLIASGRISQGYGLRLDDAELLAFMQRHARADGGLGARRPPVFMFGAPFHEITDALHKITNQRFNEEELYFVRLEGGTEQRWLQRRLIHQFASRWASWWEENRQRFTSDAAHSKVNLSPLTNAPKAAGRVGQPFPTGEKVRASEVWSNVVVGPPQPQAFYRTFHDLDTNRQTKWPADLPSPENAKADVIAAWAAREGLDLYGTVYQPPGSDRSYFALRGLALRAWQIDNQRFEAIEAELLTGKPPELGREAGELLMDFAPETNQYHPENKATFLFTTREGATGVLQVTGLITELIGPNDIGKPPRDKSKQGFYLGAQFQFKLLYEDGNVGREEP